MKDRPIPTNPEGSAVPLFGTWRRAYLAIVVVFFLEVAFFYFVSRYFS